MVIRVPGYVNNQTIRKDAGSITPEDFVFTRISDTILIDNLDTTDGAYIKFDGTADTGSTSFYVPPAQARAFDVIAGSVSILGSEGATPEFQVVSLDSQTE